VSSLFQVSTRAIGGGAVKFVLGVGPIVGGHMSQGLWIDPGGAVFAVDNGGPAVNWNCGVPFDANGRVMITTTLAVDRIAPGPIPLASNGSVVWAGLIDHYVHGVAYAATGALAV
jgi:hypothetical protein